MEMMGVTMGVVRVTFGAHSNVLVCAASPVLQSDWLFSSEFWRRRAKPPSKTIPLVELSFLKKRSYSAAGPFVEGQDPCY